jgi:hypothetical protein
MYSGLHMHVASIQLQDDIRYAAQARLAKQAKQASGPVATTAGAPRGRWVALRRMLVPSVRRAH